MKTFEGRVNGQSWTVRVVEGDHRRPLELRATAGGTTHSPTGHSWGYNGSGPAQLAHDLIAEVTGTLPPPTVYQRYKSEVIARLPMDQGWRLSERAIEEWLAETGWAPDAVMDRLDHVEAFSAEGQALVKRFPAAYAEWCRQVEAGERTWAKAGA